MIKCVFILGMLMFKSSLPLKLNKPKKPTKAKGYWGITDNDLGYYAWVDISGESGGSYVELFDVYGRSYTFEASCTISD